MAFVRTDVIKPGTNDILIKNNFMFFITFEFDK